MQVRRVITGHDAEGRAVFVRDQQVDAIPIPGLGELAFLWNANVPATYPNAGNNPAAPGIFPPVGGIRLDRDRLSAGAFNFLDHRRGRIGAFRVGDGHLRPVCRQMFSDCGTDAARATRNQCNLSFKFLSHFSLPFLLIMYR